MRKFGLIGYPLKQSFSPAYFSDKFEKTGLACQYDLYPLDEVGHMHRLAEGGLVGWNVTMPYKQEVIPLLDWLDPIAARIGAVNTIKNTERGLVGYNTDVYGFSESLTRQESYSDIARMALILGTGGASLAGACVLKNLGFSTAFVSRSRGDFLYSDLDESILSSIGLVVNTTPLGMAPKISECPDIPYDYVSEQHLMYDLVYNPDKTLFLEKSESQGAAIVNGLKMLEFQAEEAWRIWNSDINEEDLIAVSKS